MVAARDRLMSQGTSGGATCDLGCVIVEFRDPGRRYAIRFKESEIDSILPRQTTEF